MTDDALWIKEWNRCAPWLQATLDFEKSETHLAVIREDAFVGRSQFWSQEHAAMVTMVTDDQDGKVCEVLVLGGDKNMALADLKAILDSVEAFARQQGCVRVRGWGRPGWIRRFAERTEGYNIDRVRMTKALL